jgi:hypothetical protein
VNIGTRITLIFLARTADFLLEIFPFLPVSLVPVGIIVMVTAPCTCLALCASNIIVVGMAP